MLDEILQQQFHRLGVLVELDHVFHQGPRRVEGEGLEIGEEVSRSGDIRLRLPVHAPVNGVVGPLEQETLAVGHQFDAGVVVLRVQIVQGFARQHQRRGDVVLHLHLFGGTEIRPQLVNSPGAIGIVAHPQVIAHQFLIVEFQLVPQKAVDAIHGEMLAPVFAPRRAGSTASR